MFCMWSKFEVTVLSLGQWLCYICEHFAEPEGPKGVPNRKGRYEGPDGELAAILERDVLETSPGVRWEHIAGLTDAKRLLEEVVVLPLWMPEYFQVQFVLLP